MSGAIKRALATLHEFASDDWSKVPSTQAAGMQAVRMETALRMVLLYFSGRPWDSVEAHLWANCQAKAGIENPREECSSRVLCDTIRSVLGASEQREAV